MYHFLGSSINIEVLKLHSVFLPLFLLLPLPLNKACIALYQAIPIILEIIHMTILRPL